MANVIFITLPTFEDKIGEDLLFFFLILKNRSDALKSDNERKICQAIIQKSFILFSSFCETLTIRRIFRHG